MTRGSRSGVGGGAAECFPKVGDHSFAELAFGMQNFSAALDRLGVDKDESDRTGASAAIEPIMNRAALHDHIACL